MKQARGIALHSAVEVNYIQKQKTFSDLPVSDITDAYITEFNKETASIEDAATKATLPEGRDSGVKMTRAYQLSVAPSIQPLWVEEPVAFDLSIPRLDDENLIVAWTGTIDIVDQFDQVRDTKSTSRKPHAEDYQLNMTGYALGFRHKTGRIEDNIILDYIVAAKEPYYLPVKSGGPVTDRDLAIFANTVESVMTDINAGTFRPNGTRNGSCSWCEYSNVCKYTSRRNNAS
jgi:hypothetical protein